MNKYVCLFLIMIILTFKISDAQRLAKTYVLNDTITYSGLASNGVTEIKSMGDSLIWFGTGAGLSFTTVNADTFISFYPNGATLPRGGISAIAIQDSLIWIAGAFDSSIAGVGDLPTGGGLAFSTDSGYSWTRLDQPTDNKDSTSFTWNGKTVRRLPITTPINNVTYDIALNFPYVYIVSWAGGLRRYNMNTETWQIIPLPPDDKDYLFCSDSIDFEINPNDPPNGGNHNHKGFSVLAYGDTLWVGTANGINRGIIQGEECINWTKYTAQNSNISGNFVVALGRQVRGNRETIWAATLPAEGATEYRAVSKSMDGGISWHTVLRDERAYNFAFQDSVVYVATERGLFKSIDGENFALYQPITSRNANDNIFSHDVFAALVVSAPDSNYLWIGTADGIARTKTDGLEWQVYRSFVSTSLKGQPVVYAYPNPFSPSRYNFFEGEGHVRFQYYLSESQVPARVSLEIYDFSMDLVSIVTEKSLRSTPGDYAETWTGKNRSGELVANGVYFCKLTIDSATGTKAGWTKLVIIK